MNKLILNLKRNLNGSNDEYIFNVPENTSYILKSSETTHRLVEFTVIEKEQLIPHIENSTVCL